MILTHTYLGKANLVTNSGGVLMCAATRPKRKPGHKSPEMAWIWPGRIICVGVGLMKRTLGVLNRKCQAFQVLFQKREKYVQISVISITHDPGTHD